MKPTLRLILIALCLIATTALPAQPPLSHLYTAADGMAMTESADVAADRLGYLWVLSTNGRVSRFDGQHWKAYPADGPEGLIFSYAFQLKNRDVLAMRGETSQAKHLTILRGDTLIPIHGLPEVVNLLNITKQNHIYLNADEQVFRVRTSDYQIDSTFQLVYPPAFRPGSSSFCNHGNILLHGYQSPGPAKQYCWNGTRSPADIFTLPDNGYIMGYIDGQFLVKSVTDPTPELSIYDSSLKFIKTIDYPSTLEDNSFNILSRPGGNHFLQVQQGVSASNKNFKIRLYHFYPERPEKIRLFLEFYPRSATGVKWNITKDGSLWVAGHAGVERYYPGTHVLPSTQQGMVNSLHAMAEETDGSMLFGGYGSGFARLRGDSLERLVRAPFNPTAPVMPDSYRDELGQILFMLDGHLPVRGLLKFKADGTTVNIPIPDPKNPSGSLTGYHFSEAILPTTAPVFKNEVFPDGQDSVQQLVISLAGSPTPPDNTRKGQFALLDLPVKDKPVFRIVDGRKGIETINVVCTAQDKKGRIWFSQASTGIGVYDPVQDTAITWLVDRDAALGGVSMVIDRNDRLWFGGISGLYYMDNASDIALDRSLHLRARQIKCQIREIPEAYVAALLLHQDTLFVGHLAGVSRINVNDSLPSPPTLFFPTGNFLGMTEQNALLLDKHGMLWVGADDGAVRLDQSVFGRGRRMQTKLSIAIEGGLGPVAPDVQGNFALPLGDRTMAHGYVLPVADQFSEAFTADVFLLNDKGDTLISSQNLQSGETVQTPHLYPGAYSVVTRLFANNQLLEDRKTTVWVPYHLTERWWFWAALVVALLTFLVFVQNARIKRQKLISQLTRAQLDLSETRREKDRMQISTLAGTINPHFISNAIEWLQSAYLVKRPIEKMDEMAENLSDVIRMIFTKAFSETPSHPLKTELGLVERYFRTVNIQYDEAFDFRLPPQEDIDALGHYEVLLMQLQVHVENAVEHGLRYRNKAHKVSIRLRQDDDYIYATVEDDGAGVDYVRKKQAEMNRRNGVGTSIMQKLQHTFNQYNKLNLDTTINSPISIDQDGNPYGTRVTVVIPKHYSYDLKSLGS